MRAPRSADVSFVRCVFIAVALLGCGGGGGGEVIAVIGPEGGELQSNDGRLTIVVPEGALASSEKISIASVEPADLGPEFEDIEVGYAYELGPDGLEFQEPATARLRTDQQPVKEGGAFEATGGFLLTSDGAELEVLGDPGVQVDPVEGEVALTGELSHFSPIVNSKLGGNVVARFEGVPAEAEAGQQFPVTVRLSVEVLEVASVEYVDFSNPPVEPVGFQSKDPMEVPEIGTREFEAELTYECAGAGKGYYSSEFVVRFDEQAAGVSAPSLFMNLFSDRSVLDCLGGGGALETGVFPAPAGLTALEGIFPIGTSLANVQGTSLAALAGAEGYAVFDLAGGTVVLDRTTSDISSGGPFFGAAAARGPNGAAALFAFGAGALEIENAENGEFLGPGMPRLDTHFDAFPAGGVLDADEVSITSDTNVSFFQRSADSNTYVPSGFDQNVDLLSFSGRVPVSAYTETQDGAALVITWVDQARSGPAQLHIHPRAGSPAPSGVDLPANDARKIRCAGGVCAISLFGADQIAIATWDGQNAPTLADTPANTGDGPVDLDLFTLDGGNVQILAANVNDSTITSIEATPAGGVAGTKTVAAPDGCQGPGHIARIPNSGSDGKAVVTCRESDNYAIIDLAPLAP